MSKETTSPPLSQTYPSNWTPLHIKEEIFMRMKAKYISKLIIMSKSWSSIIRSKDFTDLYLTRSLTRPRILFTVDRRDIETQFFYSCSQEDPSSDHHTVSCYSRNWCDFSPPVRGLISALNGKSEVMIGNPSTGQFVTLPRVRTWRKEILFFFGYDPVGGVYKVLCMTVSSRRKPGSGDGVSQEHQVFTLGATNKKWRMIECKHLHYVFPKTQGICSNGVVYYLAWVNDVHSLICFDVGSETFSVVKLPEEVDVSLLANYGETIAVMNHLYDSTFDFWVLEDASKQLWSDVSVVMPSWTSFFRYPQRFRFIGTLGTGELIFAPRCTPTPFLLLCYDPKENKARKFLIEGFGDHLLCKDVFVGHVESPMFLQL